MNKDEIISEIQDHKSELHYTDLAAALSELSNKHGMTERQISSFVDLSKTEVNRLLSIARLDSSIQITAKEKNIQKYALLDYLKLSKELRSNLYEAMVMGNITNRRSLKINMRRFL